MNAPTKISEVTPQVITFLLDGKPVEAFEGESILKAAERSGVCIPHLCYKDGLRADGNCRACVVEIKGERTLAPSCCRSATAGMTMASTRRAPPAVASVTARACSGITACRPHRRSRQHQHPREVAAAGPPR